MGKQIVGFFGLLAWLAAASVLHAQPAIKMMIPANPGGGWDQTGRQLAAAMQGVPKFIVERQEGFQR